ncbi:MULTISPECIES: sugar phosphate isomerase/epimerase family protein [Nitrincola]|uniref:Inosose isomerase n=1 Tax=Nitrincola nitratireducens TaxID=1229521 RepID=W9V1V4_9GAMM|nr:MULTISPECIES: sugar phosphate isomerase/epimerase family protein [Nitrincola]EXJ10147.1 Inosose isomerase [Nitrincola nitratireducens]
MFSISASLVNSTHPESLKLIRDAGFTTIDLSHHDFGADVRDIDQIREFIQNHDIKIGSSSGLREFGGNNSHIHEYDMDLAKSYIKTMNRLGCELLIVTPPTIRSRNIQAERIKEDLQALANLAIPYKVKIGLKALSWSPYIGSYQEALSLVDEINSPNLGLVLDTFHFFSESEDLSVVASIPTSRIFLVQCSDFASSMTYSLEDQIETYHHKRLIPGQGFHELGIQSLITELNQRQYKGLFSIFANDQQYQLLDPYESLKQVLAFTSKFTTR